VSLIVADAGPIRYLVLCEAIVVLSQLYRRLVIPSAVAEELAHPHTPAAVRAWMAALPSWASVHSAMALDPASQLGLGEREAIALACELHATQLLVDDRAARRIAAERGLLFTGTIGILEKAAERGLLSLPEAVQRLLRTNFRVDPDVVRAVLERRSAKE
jgi:predicted nucleic acid-binding protein